MLDRSVLHSKYRARFFRLTETFLSSTFVSSLSSPFSSLLDLNRLGMLYEWNRLLPSSLIASFIKRLARLALTAPPAAVVIVIPFVYNLLKMHPGCMPLIHRDMFGGTEGEVTLESLAQDGTKGQSSFIGLFRKGQQAEPLFLIKKRPVRCVNGGPVVVESVGFVLVGDCELEDPLPLFRL